MPLLKVTCQFPPVGVLINEVRDLKIIYPKGNFTCRIANNLGHGITIPLLEIKAFEVVYTHQFINLLPAYISFKSEAKQEVETEIEVSFCE